jgi:hypothetical protein
MALLADISVSADEWDNPGELTKKMIIEAFVHCFTDERTYVRFGETKFVNSNLAKIREIFRDNQHNTLTVIVKAVVAHFEKVDENVKSGLNPYHVEPFEERPPKVDKNMKRGRFEHREQAPKRVRFERGACGKTDHDCNAQTCIIFGEVEAKPPGYVWAPGEPNVWLTADRVKELTTKKPHIKFFKDKPEQPQSRGGGAVRGGGRGGFHRGGGYGPRGGGRGGGGYRGSAGGGRGGYRGGAGGGRGVEG